MSTNSFPTFDTFPQGMDFLKQLWAQGATPPSAAAATPALQHAMGQYFMPSFDVEELDKRITDLRTVLQFMEMNTNMLRQSLSALEVQRNTIATINSMARVKADPTTSTPTDTKDFAAPWMAAWQTMMDQAQAPAAAPKASASQKTTAKKSTAKKPIAKKPKP
jgi:hypothetical protein